MPLETVSKIKSPITLKADWTAGAGGAGDKVTGNLSGQVRPPAAVLSVPVKKFGYRIEMGIDSGIESGIEPWPQNRIRN
jgi:hypothetical protein